MRWRNAGTLRILDFDTETRRVGFHTGGRFAPDGCEPTTIAYSWVGEKPVHVVLQPESSLTMMLAEFAEIYAVADIVTGHYLRRFDLPVLNGAMLEHGLPMLGPKLVVDTKADLRSFVGLSKTQENLAGMLRLEESKFHMADFRWRPATRLAPEGVPLARKRAASDVRQHKALRQALLNLGALKPPRLWSP